MLNNQPIVYVVIVLALILIILSVCDCDNKCNNQEHFRYEEDNYKTLKKNYRILPGCRHLNPRHVPKLTSNKREMRRYLKARGYPVAKGFAIKQGRVPSESDLDKKLRSINIKFPVILKPAHDTGGNGVVSGITNVNDLRREIRKAKNRNEGLVIEEQLEGIVYRILYVNKKLVAVSSRAVPYVVGNGRDKLVTLIQRYNKGLIKQNSKNYPAPVNYGLIKSQGFKLKDRVPVGRKVVINNILNYHGGAITTNFPTSKMHPENKKMFRKLLGHNLDSNCLGVDFISPDLSVPYYENGGTILEFNSDPARMLHDVMEPGFKKRYMEALKQESIPRAKLQDDSKTLV